ncbi:hypothetical protein [Nocardia brasiliensis]|uniref:hypothetical protein n=1 Tax=Nocardia brasiliensis TaxID=37326 RepID=UPI002454A186|nr:hypothetical protein [Nocardia brasiliensis]
MKLEGGGCRGIGYTIGTRLLEAGSKVTYSLTNRKIVPIVSGLRRAAGEYVATDLRARHILLQKDSWSVPEENPRPGFGEIVWGTRTEDMQRIAWWSDSVSQDILYTQRGRFFGLSYPLESWDRLHLHYMADNSWRADNGHDVFNSRLMSTTGYGGLGNPWRRALFLHAETNVDLGRFLVRADVPTPRYLDRHPGGEILSIEPDIFAKMVANVPEFKSAVGADERAAIVMLSGDVGRHQLAADFARALHNEEAFFRDIYFSNGSQVIWIDPAHYPTLGVQLARDEHGHEANWTRFAPPHPA